MLDADCWKRWSAILDAKFPELRKEVTQLRKKQKEAS